MASSLSSAALPAARTVIGPVWFTSVVWALLCGLVAWVSWGSDGWGVGQVLVLLAVFLVLNLPGFRYAGWLGRVGRDAATTADLARVLAWTGWIIVSCGVSVFVSGGALLALLLGGGNSPASVDAVAPASGFPLFVALTGLLAHARPWLRALTAAQGARTSRPELTPSVRRVTPWVRGTQLALLVTPILDAVQTIAPQRWATLIFVLMAVFPLILMLEFSLRFARASAQELLARPAELPTA